MNNFTFMLACIVTDFILNNQPDALIIQIYSVIKQSQDETVFHPDSAWERSS